MDSLPDLLIRHLPDLLRHRTDLLPVVILAAWVAYLIREKRRPPPSPPPPVQVQVLIVNAGLKSSDTGPIYVIRPSEPRKP